MTFIFNIYDYTQCNSQMGCLPFCRFTTEISVFATEREFGQPLWKLKHKKYQHNTSLTTQTSPLKEASLATLWPIYFVTVLSGTNFSIDIKLW